MCNEYNGYPNYQTWNVSLWLDNDEGTYRFFREVVKETRPTEWELSNQLKDYVEESNPLSDNASMFSDLLGHALDNVDYHEIAENILSEFEDD